MLLMLPPCAYATMLLVAMPFTTLLLLIRHAAIRRAADDADAYAIITLIRADTIMLRHDDTPILPLH